MLSTNLHRHIGPHINIRLLFCAILTESRLSPLPQHSNQSIVIVCCMYVWVCIASRLVLCPSVDCRMICLLSAFARLYNAYRLVILATGCLECPYSCIYLIIHLLSGTFDTKTWKCQKTMLYATSINRT